MTIIPMTYSGHVKAVLKLGLPLVASNVAQVAIQVTDTLMLGWYDVTALAAGTLATSLFFIIFLLGAGFAQAVTPLVASAAETGDETTVRRVTRMGVWLSVFFGLIVAMPFLYAEDILLAIGQPVAVAEQAGDYLFIAIWGMVPALIVMTLKGFLVALELTAAILWVTVGAAVLNAVLNYALIFGNLGAPELGIEGAAIASTIMQVATLVMLAIYAVRRLPQYQLMRNPFKPDPAVMGQVFKLGMPIGLTSLAEAGLFGAVAIMMGWIGEIPLAAHGIALQLSGITFVMHLSLGQAATVRAGRAVGRGDNQGLRRGALAACSVSAVLVAVTIFVFLAFPGPLVAAFVDPQSPVRAEVLALGVALLGVSALFQLVDAAQVMALGLLRGVRDTAVPLMIAIISYWLVAFPLAYLMAFSWGFGPVGLWLGLTIGLSGAAIFLMWRFWANRAGLERG